MTTTDPSTKKKHSIWLVIVANLLAVIIIIAALEFWASRHVEPPRRHIVDSFQFNHTWKPNGEKNHTFLSWRSKGEFKSYMHRYNSQGWIEDYDVEITKPEGTFRIFFIGDSHTEGTVSMEESVPSRVETHLNRLATERGLDTRFEVINTGTSSYSPTIYYVLFRYAILDFNPDLIVVNMGMNDDFDDWKYRETVIMDSDGNPVAVPPRDIYGSEYFEGRDSIVQATPWTRLQVFLAEHSSLFTLFLQFRKDKYQDIQKETAAAWEGMYPKHAWMKSDDWDDQVIENVNYTLDLLRRLLQLAKSEGVKVMTTSIPSYGQYNTWKKVPRLESTRPHREIENLSTKEDVPYLDLYQTLYAKIKPTEQKYYYYRNDGHLNPRGYKIWSDAQIEFMLDKENQLLPESVYN